MTYYILLNISLIIMLLGGIPMNAYVLKLLFDILDHE